MEFGSGRLPLSLAKSTRPTDQWMLVQIQIGSSLHLGMPSQGSRLHHILHTLESKVSQSGVPLEQLLLGCSEILVCLGHDTSIEGLDILS